GAHFYRGIVEKANEGGIERRLFVGRTGMGKIVERGEVSGLPAGLAIARLRQLDELVIRNHLALRRRPADPSGQALRNGSPYGLKRFEGGNAGECPVRKLGH